MLAQFRSAYSGDGKAQLRPAYVEQGTPIVVVTDFDAGNVKPSTVVVTNAYTVTPTIQAGMFLNGDVRWRHFLFRLDNATGKRPFFDMDGSGKISGTFTSAWAPMWTTDFVTWHKAPSRSLANSRIQWQFDAPFTDDTVYIASKPVGQFGMSSEFADELLSNHSAVATANLSADGSGVFNTTRPDVNDQGTQIGSNDRFAIKLAWPGPTTDGLRKRKFVMMAGIHAAGENHSWFAFTAAVRWALDSTSAEAVAFRKNWEMHLYFLVNPNGVRGGNTRYSFSGGDPNRAWKLTPGASSLDYINTLAAAILTDTGGSADAFISWHGADATNQRYNLFMRSGELNPTTRTAPVWAMVNNGRTIFAVEPNIIDSELLTTDSWWGTEKLGAKVSFDGEIQGLADQSIAEFTFTGEAWIETVQSVDAQGLFLQAEIGTGEAVASGLKASTSFGVSINSNAGEGAARGLLAGVEAGRGVSLFVGRAVASGFSAGISQQVTTETGRGLAAGLVARIAGDQTIEVALAYADAAGLPVVVFAGKNLTASTGFAVASGASAIIATVLGEDQWSSPIYSDNLPLVGYVTMDFEQDHASIAWGHFLAQYGDSPRLESVVRSLYAPVQEANGALRELVESRGLETAIGRQLDGIGEIVGQTREVPDLVYIKFFGFVGQPNIGGFGEERMRQQNESATVEGSTTLLDAEYRKLLYWKIGLNNGHGTAPEIAASLRAIFDATQVRIVDQGNARVGVWFNTTPQTNPAFLANPLRWIPVAAGVGVEILTGAERQVFGFSNQGLWGFDVGSFQRTTRI